MTRPCKLQPDGHCGHWSREREVPKGGYIEYVERLREQSRIASRCENSVSQYECWISTQCTRIRENNLNLEANTLRLQVHSSTAPYRRDTLKQASQFNRLVILSSVRTSMMYTTDSQYTKNSNIRRVQNSFQIIGRMTLRKVFGTITYEIMFKSPA